LSRVTLGGLRSVAFKSHALGRPSWGWALVSTIGLAWLGEFYEKEF
jgi:hypothetical protein